MKAFVAAAALALLSAGPAAAEITARSDTGFTLSHSAEVTAAPEAILAAVTRPAAWWSDAHTYSGSASNIRLEAAPGGCWCEDLPGGGVKHGEVLILWPERRMIRFEAPFGPLQGMGARAVLTMSWADPAEGQARRLRWSFVAEGPGAGSLADAVEGVMSEQFARLTAHLAD